jgi:hypothetical protein
MRARLITASGLRTLFLLAVVLTCSAAPVETSIFPRRRRSQARTDFRVDDGVVIVIPACPGEQDIFLAQTLTEELADHFGVSRGSSEPGRCQPGAAPFSWALFPTLLVRTRLSQTGFEAAARKLGPEGYIPRVDSDSILVAGSDDRGAF